MDTILFVSWNPACLVFVGACPQFYSCCTVFHKDPYYHMLIVRRCALVFQWVRLSKPLHNWRNVSDASTIGQTVTEISWFFNQTGGLWKFRYFKARQSKEGQYAPPCHILWRLVKLLPRYCTFPAFKMVAICHLGFLTLPYLTFRVNICHTGHSVLSWDRFWSSTQRVCNKGHKNLSEMWW